MKKKLMMTGAVLVFSAALALPAVASASPILTESGGKVEVGRKILGTQLGNSKVRNTEGTITYFECGIGIMKGELTKNNGTEIEGKIMKTEFGGTGPGGECTASFPYENFTAAGVVSEKAPWCVRSVGTDEWTLSGGACPGGGTIKLTMVFTGIGACEYESTSHLLGSYTTNGTSAVLTLNNTTHGNNPGEGTSNGFKRVGTNMFCLSSISLNMQFTFETDESAVKPLVIS